MFELPTFSGTYAGWPSFWNQFKVAVHEQRLSEIHKFTYLKTCVHGEALDLINALKIEEASYETALFLLRRRYEDSKLVIRDHMDDIVNAPPAKQNNAASLRKLVNTFQDKLTGLENSGVTTGHIFLTHIILQKVDEDTRRAWEIAQMEKAMMESIRDGRGRPTVHLEEQNKSETTKDLNKRCDQKFRDLMEFLFERVQISDRADFNQRAHWQAHNVSALAVSGDKGAAGYVTGIAVIENTTGSDAARTSNKGCATSPPYLNDGSRHQQGFVKGDDGTRREQESVAAKDGIRLTDVGDGTHPADNDGSRRTTTDADGSCLSTDDGTRHVSEATPSVRGPTVFLCTAIVPVITASGRTVTVRTLFDTGSQVDLISERAAMELGHDLHDEPIALHGVGGVCTARGRLTVPVVLPGGQLSPITCHVMPQVVGKFQRTALPASFLKQFDGYNLADPNFLREDRIDMLVGVGNFHQFVRCDVVQMGSIYLQRTLFGWAVTGKPQQPAGQQAHTASTPSLVDAAFYHETDATRPSSHTLDTDWLTGTLKVNVDGYHGVIGSNDVNDDLDLTWHHLRPHDRGKRVSGCDQPTLGLVDGGRNVGAMHQHVVKSTVPVSQLRRTRTQPFKHHDLGGLRSLRYCGDSLDGDWVKPTEPVSDVPFFATAAGNRDSFTVRRDQASDYIAPMDPAWHVNHDGDLAGPSARVPFPTRVG